MAVTVRRWWNGRITVDGDVMRDYVLHVSGRGTEDDGLCILGRLIEPNSWCWLTRLTSWLPISEEGNGIVLCYRWYHAHFNKLGFDGIFYPELESEREPIFDVG